MIDAEIVKALVQITVAAGEKILSIYNGDFEVFYKKDSSPLTAADTASHVIITRELRTISLGGKTLPILSEESSRIPFGRRNLWKEYWLLDPLDGTKEFIKKNGEFTVNICLIRDGSPHFGLVYAPVLDVLYYGGPENGSFRLGNTLDAVQKGRLNESEKLPADGGVEESGEAVIVASRSHMTEATKEYINAFSEKHGDFRTVSIGSSLKLCLVAEGTADLYPRLAPTMEWDTAAAHAVCRGAGASVVSMETGEELQYNKEDLTNPWFVVKRR